jgi:hypothetical protein
MSKGDLARIAWGLAEVHRIQLLACGCSCMEDGTFVPASFFKRGIPFAPFLVATRLEYSDKIKK